MRALAAAPLAAATLAAVTIAVAGCYSPDIPNGALGCSVAARKCPSGYQCLEDNHCWRNGTGPDLGGGGDGGPSPDLAGAMPKNLGDSCVVAGECASGFCADGVCCATACTSEPCKACNLSGSAGTCSPVAAGSMPAAGHASCGPDAPSTCMRSGTCDSAGGCALYDASTVCKARSCDATTNQATGDAKCDAAGHCGTATAITCAPFICDPSANACYVTCSTSAQCSGTNSCNGGSCGPKPNGSACTSGTQCMSTVCADGVCCNTACGGQCQACNLSSTLGTCVTVTNATTPRCMGTSSCNGSGVCLLDNGQSCSSGGQCVSNACIGSICCNDGTCTGGCQTCSSGTCTNLANGSTGSGCGLYLCQGGPTCPTSCTMASQCTTNFCSSSNICATGTCFAAGTPVHTPAGTRPIEQLHAGDLVDSFDVRSGRQTQQPVVRVETRLGAGLIALTVAGGAPIEVTGEHYFWVDGPGWVRAEDLRLGDRLLTVDGSARILTSARSLFAASEGVIVYNLVVAETDSYFVGVEPVLVHSCDYMTFSGRPRSSMPQ